MMEAAGTSETSVNFYQTTRRNNPEDIHLHICCRDNKKSHLTGKEFCVRRNQNGPESVISIWYLLTHVRNAVRFCSGFKSPPRNKIMFMVCVCALACDHGTVPWAWYFLLCMNMHARIQLTCTRFKQCNIWNRGMEYGTVNLLWWL
jgi:hypothetical protein